MGSNGSGRSPRRYPPGPLPPAAGEGRVQPAPGLSAPATPGGDLRGAGRASAGAGKGEQKGAKDCGLLEGNDLWLKDALMEQGVDPTEAEWILKLSLPPIYERDLIRWGR